jgi:hypothetical protein
MFRTFNAPAIPARLQKIGAWRWFKTFRGVTGIDRRGTRHLGHRECSFLAQRFSI